MPTQSTEAPEGVAAAVREVKDHATALGKLQLELAQIELKRKAPLYAVGVGLGLGAALVVLYALGFAFAGAASGLATVVPMWAALLIVAGALLILATVLGLLAKQRLSQGGAPVPELAIEEAKATQEVLQADVHA